MPDRQCDYLRRCLVRLGVTDGDDGGYWHEVSAVDAIQRAYELRNQLHSARVERSWRDSISWVGAPSEDQRAVKSEYERSDQRIQPQSGWHSYYRGVEEAGTSLQVPIICNSGMAAIASTLMGLVSGSNALPLRLLASGLYFETKELLAALGSSQVAVEELSEADLLALLRVGIREPSILYLDSADRTDSVKVFRTLQGLADRNPGVSAIVWDTSLVPYWEHCFERSWDWPVPLILVRSLQKLDQMGLEIVSLGLTSIIVDKASGITPACAKRCVQDIKFGAKLIGAFARHDSVELFERAKFPQGSLDREWHARVVSTNRLIARHLQASLAGTGHGVWSYPHGVFTTIELRKDTSVEGRMLLEEVEHSCSREQLPLWRGASIGNQYSSMTAHLVEDGMGRLSEHLRIAPGGHDADVAEKIATTVADTLKRLG